MRVERTFFVAESGSNEVQLSPTVGSESRPNEAGIVQIRVRTSASTPPTGIFGTVGSCATFRVILEKVE